MRRDKTAVKLVQTQGTSFCMFKMQATEEERENWVRAEETGILSCCNFNGMSSVSIK